jgi:hypothetical protein
MAEVLRRTPWRVRTARSRSEEYLSTPQRAMHSKSSESERETFSRLSRSPSPLVSSSTACERRKFHRACAMLSRATYAGRAPPMRSSPVICDSCTVRHSPVSAGSRFIGGCLARSALPGGEGASDVTLSFMVPAASSIHMAHVIFGL